METKNLKTDLLCLGARLSVSDANKGVGEGGNTSTSTSTSRRAGAGPAAGGMFIFGGTVANVPTQSWFVSASPYCVSSEEGKNVIKKDGEKVAEVTFPRARFQRLKTKDGVPYSKIALLHGVDCLATTTVQTCVYWNTPKRCKFCAIELSLKSGATVARKEPEQLAEVAVAAKKLDRVTHVTLTSGTTATPDKGINLLTETAKAIKDATGLPVHAQFEPPKELSRIDALYDSVDTVGIHAETFDRAVLKAVAPCKAEIPFQHYLDAWKRSVKIFGESQVSSYVIAGLGESDESLVAGCKLLAELGVYPFLVPLRPIPGSLLEREKPPSPSRMRRVYEQVAEVLRECGAERVSWRKNKAGCVRCRACSALPDFE